LGAYGAAFLSFREAVLILIALGANLPSEYGDPLKTLHAAIVRIDAHEGVHVVARSHVYKSAPVPLSDQPWYHNAVIAVETDLTPLPLLLMLQEIEVDFGRRRDDGDRNAARTLDLDIVAYHDVVMDEAGLEIPHPRMADRAFVLLPIRDVSPRWQHPVSEAFIADMIDGLPDGQDLHKIEDDAHG